MNVLIQTISIHILMVYMFVIPNVSLVKEYSLIHKIFVNKLANKAYMLQLQKDHITVVIV